MAEFEQKLLAATGTPTRAVVHGSQNTPLRKCSSGFRPVKAGERGDIGGCAGSHPRRKYLENIGSIGGAGGIEPPNKVLQTFSGP